MTLIDFVQIAQYANETWKGNYTPQEVRQNAEDYYSDFLWSKENDEIAFNIKELSRLLQEDGTEKAVGFLSQIAEELGLVDMVQHRD